MGGFFGITSTKDCLLDVFFGTDYHSHLGTQRGGLAAYDPEIGLQRKIHSITNAPFRTKFETIFDEMKGIAAIGCISDTDPQPMLIRSNHGTYAICTIGIINNAEALIDQYLSFSHGHFDAMTGGRVNTVELVAALIDQKSSFGEGIKFAQSVIDGTCSILILKENGHLIAARDKVGRIPVIIGKGEDGYSVTFESFASLKLGYEMARELGPGEIVELSPEDGIRQLNPPGKEMKMCAFLWSYYGYPTSNYEGINVEAMRYRNGEILAEQGYKLGKNYIDCGCMIYNIDQNCYQGGSGAGCSASVFNSYIMEKLKSGEISRVAYFATGALMSSQSCYQGETIPCISHGVVIRRDDVCC